MSEYKSIFTTKTFDTLTKKSADSLRTMLGGKSFMQASMESMEMLPEIIEAEAPHISQLEELAKEIVYRVFPIVKQSGIKIDAKLVPLGQFTLNQNDQEESEIPSEEELKQAGISKRRITNAITQGAAIRGTKAYYVFRDIISLLDDTILDRYSRLINNAYGIYDDDNAIAMMLAMMAQNAASQGGESEVEWDEDKEVLIIKAQAVVFPILIHEIVKGLYEFISLQGFSKDAESNRKIVQNVDRVSNEPEDLRYGKFIYDALNQHVVDSDYDNDVMRELFFIEVYKLEDTEFHEFVEDSINDSITPTQKRWVELTLKTINSENK